MEGSKHGFPVGVTSAGGFTTGSTGTVKVLARIIASSLENLSAHLSSKFLRSSAEGLLLDLFLEAEGDSLRFVFLVVGVCCTSLTFSTLASTLTCAGSTRVGVELVDVVDVFLSVPVSWGGQLKDLVRGKPLADNTFFLLDAGVVA